MGKRKIDNMFKSSSHRPVQKGNAGYDGGRENIDPHIKTKVISSLEGNVKQIIVGDHGTAATDMVVNVCYGTSATPPAASTTTEGTLYIQYTA